MAWQTWIPARAMIQYCGRLRRRTIAIALPQLAMEQSTRSTAARHYPVAMLRRDDDLKRRADRSCVRAEWSGQPVNMSI